MSDRVDIDIDGLQDFEPVGAGGFATVYVATDPEFGRQVAVKVFNSIDADGRRRFDRERRLMGGLGDHPNVVTPFRSGYTSSGQAYLVMEYLRGGSLQDVIDVRGAMTLEAALDHIIPVAYALQQAHRDGILHRDIKPANILLTDGDHPSAKLSDFGIASVSEATSTQRAFTLTHSPPETFADVDRRDERSDLYSLASTLYQLVVGRGPFDALDGSRAVEGHMARILTSPVPEIGHRPLDTFLARAMAKDPDHRHPDAQGFIDELATIRAGLAASPPTSLAPQPAHLAPVVDDTPPPFTSEAGGPGRSQRKIWSLIAAGAVALAGIGGLGAFAFARDSDDDLGGFAGTAEGVEVEGSGGEEEVEVEETPEEETPEEEVEVPPAPLEPRTINVAIIGNPTMEEIALQTPTSFTPDTGITVDFTVIEGGAVADYVREDVGRFDAVMIGMSDTPQFGANGWLQDLTPFVDADPGYDVEGVIPSVRQGLSGGDRLFASPFYAESSFLVYRQDLLDEAGLEMPANPTWAEVAEIAETIDSDEVAGICLRGRPGWGDLGASFTTVLNTFGGTWWEANDDGSIGEAQVDQPEFAEALTFYVDLVNNAGQDTPADDTFGDCLAHYQQGEVAMWYESTFAAVVLESDDSAVKGLNGYAAAPTNRTSASGWLWSWNLAIPENSPDPEAAWEFISWATADTFAGETVELLPPQAQLFMTSPRTSTYSHPAYQSVADPFDQATLEAITSAPIGNPGTSPRPGFAGVQYVGVPEFQDVATRCTQLFSAAIAGSIDVDSAIADCQVIAAGASG